MTTTLDRPAAAPVRRDSALRRLGRFSFRRHWLVIVIWVVALVGLGAASGALGNGYTTEFGDIGSESDRGFDLLAEGFGGSAGGEQGTIVFAASSGVDDPAVRSEIEQYLTAVDELDGLEVQSPFGPGGERQIASTGDLAGELAYATVTFPPDTNFETLQKIAGDARDLAPDVRGLRIEYGGEVFGEFEPPESELIGIGFAIVILILVFGSVLAMGLPIGMAMAGIGAGVSIVGLISLGMEMPEFTTTIGIMIGLGVGIDYALFIITRYREDRLRGMDPEHAAGHAIDTAGRAVLFAGLTVMISLLGMIAMGLGFIRGLGIGAATIVACSVVASLTLLPALLGAVGHRIELTRRRGVIAAGLVAIGLVGVGLGIEPLTFALPLAAIVLILGFFVRALKKPLPPRPVKDRRATFAYRWSRLIQRDPWQAAIAGLALLVVLALPVLGLRLGFSDTGNAPESTTTRQAYDLLAEGFGPGFNGPLMLVSAVPEGTDPADLERVGERLSDTPGIANVSPPTVSQSGDVVRWVAFPTTAPQDAETTSLVRDLRDDVLPAAAAGTDLDVLVTGFTAVGIDYSDYLAARYPLFFGVVLGLSFILLMAVFRSLLVPLKAVVMNLLSIGAAYGIITAIFQWGWAKDVVGIGKGGPIEPFVPMMLFAIVFGLSMDYEVFLLSRIKEEYDRTGDNASAVADGLAATARVITAAAAIMVVVFGSFLLEDDRSIKLVGLGLALAVLLDATVVRMLLVPATMELLGDRNWWLPRWLDRILPAIHIEGRPDPSDELGGGDDDPDDVPEPPRVPVQA